jgi:hypothetical protein
VFERRQTNLYETSVVRHRENQCRWLNQPSRTARSVYFTFVYAFRVLPVDHKPYLIAYLMLLGKMKVITGAECEARLASHLLWYNLLSFTQLVHLLSATTQFNLIARCRPISNELCLLMDPASSGFVNKSNCNVKCVSWWARRDKSYSLF